MFRSRKHIAQLSLNCNETTDYNFQQTEISSEMNSPEEILPQQNQSIKHSLRKHSNLLPAAQQSSTYIFLPQIQEKFLTPRSNKINLMPGLAFEDLFKNPIYYHKDGLNPQDSEKILRKYKMRLKKVDFQNMVDIVNESRQVMIKDTIPTVQQSEVSQAQPKRSRYSHLSNHLQFEKHE